MARLTGGRRGPSKSGRRSESRLYHLLGQVASAGYGDALRALVLHEGYDVQDYGAMTWGIPETPRRRPPSGACVFVAARATQRVRRWQKILRGKLSTANKRRNSFKSSRLAGGGLEPAALGGSQYLEHECGDIPNRSLGMSFLAVVLDANGEPIGYCWFTVFWEAARFREPGEEETVRVSVNEVWGEPIRRGQRLSQWLALAVVETVVESMQQLSDLETNVREADSVFLDLEINGEACSTSGAGFLHLCRREYEMRYDNLGGPSFVQAPGARTYVEFR